MPEGHALLSASSSKQWLNCTPSARLQEKFPNESSVFAEEGTFAHSVCEYKVKKYLHERVRRPQSEEYYSEELEQSTDIYYEFVVSIIEEMKRAGCEPLVMVEERVDYSHIAPSGFGTADMVIIGHDEDDRGILHICDYKNGKGVLVDYNHNTQMMLYALGALHAYGYIFPIEIIRMSIIQPRLDNIGTCEMTADELIAWGESIKETAKMAFEGKGEQKAGDWCRFCRAKPVCKACRDEALSLCREEFLDLDEEVFSEDASAFSGDARVSPEDAGAFCEVTGAFSEDTGAFSGDARVSPEDAGAFCEVTGAFSENARVSPGEEKTDDMNAPYTPDRSLPTFKQAGLISISELAEVLPLLSRISSWIESVFAFLSSEAINHAVPIPGYKVVEGRSKRVFTDTKAVVDTAIQNGYTDLYKQQLITLSEFEKMMGKKRFAELLGEYVAKPPGKLALVPENDPRPPVDLTNTPDQEFASLANDGE